MSVLVILLMQGETSFNSSISPKASLISVNSFIFNSCSKSKPLTQEGNLKLI